ncbi:MAG: hypothetical protein QM768_21680 [Agriterribacter sp.]
MQTVFFSVTEVRQYFIPKPGGGAVQVQSVKEVARFDTYPEAEKHISFMPPGWYKIDKFFINH